MSVFWGPVRAGDSDLRFGKGQTTFLAFAFTVSLKDANSASDDKVVGNDLHGSEKPERHSRNNDRPDRGVWALCHSDGSYASDESSSSSAAQSMQMPLDSLEYMGDYGDTKVDLSNEQSLQVKTIGSHKHVSRRGAVADGSSAE